MSFYAKDKFAFNPADITEDVVGSYLVGAGGSVISSTGTYLDVNIASSSGMAIFAEDSANISGDDLQAVGLVREDTLAVSTSADGDYGNFKSTNKGELYVKATDSDALLTTIDADTGAILSDTNAMVVDLAAIEVLLTSIDSDTNSIDTKLTTTNALLTTIDADTTSIALSNTSIDASITALSKAEDAAHATGDKGIMGLAVRNDVEGSLVSADGDYAPLQVDSSGRLRIIGDLDVVGNVADDAADSGNPLKIGSRGVSGVLTALSASNDRADLLSDLYRRVWVNTSPNVGVTLSKPVALVTAVEVAAAPQAGRRFIEIQNLSNKAIYWGPDNTVTTATGIRINKNMTVEFEYGEDLNIWIISSVGIVSDVRVIEKA